MNYTILISQALYYWCVELWGQQSFNFYFLYRGHLYSLPVSICVFVVAILTFCCCCLVTKSCPTLCDFMDYSPQGSSVHGISQATILDYVAISFFRVSPDSGIEPPLLHWPVLAGRSFMAEPPAKPYAILIVLMVGCGKTCERVLNKPIDIKIISSWRHLSSWNPWLLRCRDSKSIQLSKTLSSE